MITVLTGTPGAGKSCMAAVLIAEHLAKKSDNVVATNILLADDFAEQVVRRWQPRRWWLGGRESAVSSVRRRTLVVDESEDLRRVRLDGGGRRVREGQLLIVIDEAQGILDSRGSRDDGRTGWVTWATQHRKLGADLVAIVQDLEMLDAHWRRLAEHHIRLRDLRRARVWGVPLPIPLQVAHTFWVGGRGPMARRPVATRVLRTARGHGLFETTQTLHGAADLGDGVTPLWLPVAPPRPSAPAAQAPDALGPQDADDGHADHAEPVLLPPPSVCAEGATPRPAGGGQQVQR